MSPDDLIRIVTYLASWLALYTMVSCRRELTLAIRETLLAIARFMRAAFQPGPLTAGEWASVREALKSESESMHRGT